jgi:hypothetical protein
MSENGGRHLVGADPLAGVNARGALRHWQGDTSVTMIGCQCRDSNASRTQGTLHHCDRFARSPIFRRD